MPEEYEDMNRMIEKMHPQPTPCELAAANDRLMQKVSALCKERDELKRDNERLRRALDQTVVKLNDETVRAERLEAENRAKEQYIAETIGKVIKERDAAIADLKIFASCVVCKHFGENGITCDALDQCLYGEHGIWEWRGVRNEDTRCRP